MSLSSRNARLMRRSVLALFSVMSCRTPATQVQLFLDTDAVPNRAVRLEILSLTGTIAPQDIERRALSQSTGSVLLNRDSMNMGTFTAGGSVGIVPPLSLEPVTLWIRTTFAATASSPEIRTDRAARVSFIRGRSGTARVFLSIRCGDRSVGCNSVRPELCTVSVRCREQNATCGDSGECVAPEVPVGFATEDGAVADAPSASIDATSGRVDAELQDVSNDAPAADAPTADAPMCTGSEIVLGGRCVDSTLVPRQISPLSLGDTTNTNPTFRWFLPAPFDAVRIEFCADRACTTMLNAFEAAGNSVIPDRGFAPRSVVFWRLRGVVNHEASPRVSPSWLFRAPAVNAAGDQNRSFHSHNDVNGDGFDDLVVGSPFANPGGRMRAGIVSVYHGSPTGIAAIPALVLEGVASGDSFGISAAGAGDVNGDGYGDVLVGAQAADPAGRTNAGAASVFYGGPTGLSAMPTTVLEGTAMGDAFGRAVANAGDINADGYSDIIIGASSASPGGRMAAGTATVYLSRGATGIGPIPTRIFEGSTARDSLGISVASACDVNGDGFGDVLIGAHTADPMGMADAGLVNVYYGNAMGLMDVPSLVLLGVAAGDTFGRSVACAGDLDNDGFAEIVVGATNADPLGRLDAGTANVFRGGMTGLNPVANRVIAGEAAGDSFGISVAGVGDSNNDGYSELAVGAFHAAPMGRMNAGTLSLFAGSASGVQINAASVYEGRAAGDLLGISVANGVDVNGDGLHDVVVGADFADPGGRTDAGSVLIYHGQLMGFATMLTRTLDGQSAGEFFGNVVASVYRPLFQWREGFRRRPQTHRLALQ